ncbi:MAG: triose-phosphate isomerase [bacterium]|nr:triose-phosphate isomerase [bacterium]
MIFVNFKTYQEATGERAVGLAKIIKECAEETGIFMASAVQTADLKECAQIGGEVWAQHVDGLEFGRHTGAVLAEAVLEDGAKGTFLNHSEKRFADFEQLKSAVERCRAIGLKTLIFAPDVNQLRSIVSLKPDFVAYEPPNLIASIETSVAQANQEAIKETVKIAGEAGIPLIVGAGIKSREDVQVSLKLGARGVAVSSDIIMAQDSKKELMYIAEGFNS